MRTLTCTLILSAVMSLPATADDTYKFHVSLGTVADGLRAVDPAHPALTSSEDKRLQEPAMVFARIEGTRGWRATFLNCPKKPMMDCEVRINSSSSGGAERDSGPAPVGDRQYDLGFSSNGDGTVRTRCLRTSCRLRFGNTGGEETKTTLNFGESKNLPLDVDIEVTASGTGSER